MPRITTKNFSRSSTKKANRLSKTIKKNRSTVFPKLISHNKLLEKTPDILGREFLL